MLNHILFPRKKRERERERNDIVTLLGSFLSINTIILLIHLKILDLSTHELIQTSAWKSIFIHLTNICGRPLCASNEGQSKVTKHNTEEVLHIHLIT